MKYLARSEKTSIIEDIIERKEVEDEKIMEKCNDDRNYYYDDITNLCYGRG